MGRRYLDAFRSDPNGNIIALCELDPVRGNALASEFGIGEFYTDVDEMLEKASLDAVIVATPDFAHKEPVLKALAAGCDVLCEKPLSTSVDESVAIARAAKESGRQLMVNFGNRHRPSARRVKDVIARGEIGQLRYAFMCLNEKSFKTATLSWSAQTSPLWFLISHLTDFMQWIFDDRVVKVYASNGQKEGLGTTVGVLTFAGGATAVMESSWDMPNGYQRDIDVRLNIHGSKGIVDLDIGDQGLIVSGSERSSSVMWDGISGPSPDDWWNRSCHYFTHTLTNGGVLEPDAAHGLRTVLVLSALQKSIDTGAAITIAQHWPEAMEFSA
jgi:predicted dehydrogenase